MIKQEIMRFLVVSCATVIIDLASYTLFITLEQDTDVSKGISFSFGATFSYFANRLYTFDRAQGGPLRYIFFMTLYLTSLVINVTANEVILDNFGRDSFAFGLAYVVATGLSATMNFIGMKFIIFTSLSSIEK